MKITAEAGSDVTAFTSDVALTSFSLALRSVSATFLDCRCSDTLRPPTAPPPRARRSSTLAALRTDARCLVGVSSCWSFPARPPRPGEDTLAFSSAALSPFPVALRRVKTASREITISSVNRCDL